MEWFVLGAIMVLLALLSIPASRRRMSVSQYVASVMTESWRKWKTKHYPKKIQKILLIQCFADRRLLAEWKKKYPEDFFEDWQEKLQRARALLFDSKSMIEQWGWLMDKFYWRLVKDKIKEAKTILSESEDYFFIAEQAFVKANRWMKQIEMAFSDLKQKDKDDLIIKKYEEICSSIVDERANWFEIRNKLWELSITSDHILLVDWNLTDPYNPFNPFNNQISS